MRCTRISGPFRQTKIKSPLIRKETHIIVKILISEIKMKAKNESFSSLEYASRD